MLFGYLQFLTRQCMTWGMDDSYHKFCVSNGHCIRYDIRDYTKINSTYGTLEDVDRLIEATHQKGLKIILDIALNHTSTEVRSGINVLLKRTSPSPVKKHEWFQTSRSSRQSPNGPKRDWYIWHPGKEDPSGKRQPPNNWESAFGGE